MPQTSQTDLLAKVKGHEARKRLIAWIPADGSSYVQDQGYRVAIVEAGSSGYFLTGTWPYSGGVGEKMPWFWGHDLKVAQAIAEEHNAKLGVTAEEAMLIVGRSMTQGSRRAG